MFTCKEYFYCLSNFQIYSTVLVTESPCQIKTQYLQEKSQTAQDSQVRISLFMVDKQSFSHAVSRFTKVVTSLQASAQQTPGIKLLC